MIISDKIEEILEKLIFEWNLTEEYIKLAEQVVGDAVIPSIYELRYAGRKVVESFSKECDEENRKKLLEDAIFDCYRARHDSIDAATTIMIETLDNATDKLGADIILRYYGSIKELLEKLNKVRMDIATSRRNRLKRDIIYDNIRKHDLPDIVELYNKFKSSEKLMLEAAKKERRWKSLNIAFGVCGIIGTAFTLLSFFMG